MSPSGQDEPKWAKKGQQTQDGGITWTNAGPTMGWIERMLRRYVPFKEIGWEPIGEKFTRYQILKTRWGNVYLHQLDAPQWHPEGCHDHPWGFLTILLKSGYLEEMKHGIRRRRPGQVLYRPAKFRHNVVTPYGTSWSLIFTGKKSRDWGFNQCTD